VSNERWQDLEKEILKNHITAPLDGCKTMALGTVTVIGVYIALISNLFDKAQLHNYNHFAYIFSPILLFINAGFLFGLGYLPETIDDAFDEKGSKDPPEKQARDRVVKYEKHIRDYLFCGVLVFWCGVISALFILFSYPKP